jgi:hypothetical protein
MLDEYTVFSGSFGNDQEISSSSLHGLNKKLKTKLGNDAETVFKDKEWRLINAKGDMVGIYIEEPNLEYQSPYHLLHQKIDHAKVILGKLQKKEMENNKNEKILKARKIIETYIQYWEDHSKHEIKYPKSRK